MNLKKIVYISMVLLVAIIFATIPRNLSNISDQNVKPILFSEPLDLTNDQATEHTIIFYLINRDNKPEDPIKGFNPETIGAYYNISITLGPIRETHETSFENDTITSQTRFFSANYIDYNEPFLELSISGWIDEHRKIEEWDVLSIHWLNSTRGNSSPNMWVPTNDSFNMDLLYTINYTGLPESENVKIYPRNHFITDEFELIIENNRDENLYWGSDWKAKKRVDGEWVYPDSPDKKSRIS